MSLEKSIIKSDVATTTTFDFKPRELSTDVSPVAKSFVDSDAFISPDFRISDLIAQQAGISQLADEAQRDKINNQVLDRLKEIQEKAYQEGFELGQIDGAEKAFQEASVSLMEYLKNIEGILKCMEQLKTQLLIDNEAELIRLVYLVAKKMAMRDLEENRDAVWEILKNVVSEAQTDERVTVKLSTPDLLFLESLQEKTGNKIESLQRVKFIVDDNIKSGGCMIETNYGTVDASIEERVERTWATLQSRIPHHGPAGKE